MKKEEKSVKEISNGMREFKLAWQEYFKDRPKPKNDDEEKKENEEFIHWYNFVRKQTDSGKTPVEMYREIYGKEPPEKEFPAKGRMMGFEWDEDYDEELMGLIFELQEYDNKKGYKMNYAEVKIKLQDCVDKLTNKGEKALNFLHDLLKDEETWSCVFALEILKSIKSKRSIPYFIRYIIKNEKGGYGDSCEDAMLGLVAIGKPAIGPLLEEVKKQFRERNFYIYLCGALTDIKDERVYSFMKEITEDFLKDEQKYGGWFHIDIFASSFIEQENRAAIPILKELMKRDNLSRHEKIEIEDAIERLEDPEGYTKRSEEEFKKIEPLFSNLWNKKDSEMEDIDKEDIERRMWEEDNDFEVQFKCLDCDKKQNIHPGIVKIIGNRNDTFTFENEILCKYCKSNSIFPTEQGKKDILFQAIGLVIGEKKGIVIMKDKIFVEDKKVNFRKSYDYILERIEQEPRNGTLHLRAGNIARNFNKYSEAIKHYEKSLELNPKLICNYLNLVEIYEYRHKYYGLKEAKVSAIFYLEEMMNLFRTNNFDSVTLRNENVLVNFMGEMSESLGISFPELVKVPLPSIGKKIGRNEPCPCGSGKKYKKCCLDKENE
jgi:tetratricopeptide (TPR) repeat protein